MARTRFRCAGWHSAGRTLLLLAFLCPVTACYQYVPAAEPTPGAMVRARLNAAGADTLTSRFGPGVEALLGTYLGTESGGLSVLVSEYVSGRGGRQTVWNEAVRLPAGGVAQLEERRFSRTKSVLFGAGILAVASFTYVALDLGGRIFDNEDDVEPGPSEFRGRPMLSIPLSLPIR